MNAPERPEPIDILDGNPDSVGSIHVRNVYSMTDANVYMNALEAENAHKDAEIAEARKLLERPSPSTLFSGWYNRREDWLARNPEKESTK